MYYLYLQFTIDFKLLHLDDHAINQDQWVKIREFLIATLSSASITTVEDTALVQLINSGDLNSGEYNYKFNT